MFCPRARRTLVSSPFLALASGMLLCCAPTSLERPLHPTSTPGHDARSPLCEEIRVQKSTLDELLIREDTDGDKKITIRDGGPRSFRVETKCAGSKTIEGHYFLANLVQELFVALAENKHWIPLNHVEEAPVQRLSRLIKERYWDQLTRRMDAESLETVLRDSKTQKVDNFASDQSWPESCTPFPPTAPPHFLYVPHDDARAWAFYSQMVSTHPSLAVCKVPSDPTSRWVDELTTNHRHGLLSLAVRKTAEGKWEPVPYVVPGGRFNELYGWDSYFHVLGLLEDDRFDLAQAIALNQLYEVKHYGKVLNANRTYYLTRSQPPLLSSAVLALGTDPRNADKTWIREALPILEKEYFEIWNSPPRVSNLCRSVEDDGQKVCLARYHGEGHGEPPEVEPGHFDWLYRKRAAHLQMDAETYREAYKDRSLSSDELDWMDTFFVHDRAMRESGHDTTYRFTTEQGDRAADFVTVDLNSLLFKYELDLAVLGQLFAPHRDWQRFCHRAMARRQLVQEYLWNGSTFTDYLPTGQQDETASPERSHSAGHSSNHLSATTLFPLWASAPNPCHTQQGDDLSLLDRNQARTLVENAVAKLEEAGGLAATTQDSLPQQAHVHPRQWDYPFGWAPHQVLSWRGLSRYGFVDTANRLTYEWLYMIVKNAVDFHGTVPEKFDVVRRSHEVFAEYGNVGTEFDYITREGFGWMNASFQIGVRSLPKHLLDSLNDLIPPEKLQLSRHAP